MKHGKYSLLCWLFIAVLIFQPTAYAVAAEKEEDIQKVPGKLWVYTAEIGKQEVDALLVDEKLIMVSAETIGKLAGMTEIRETGETLDFFRDNYVVEINLDTGKVQIGMTYDEENAYSLYKDQNFVLSKILQEKIGETSVVMLPLEQMLYLLNVQWGCSDECVFAYAPPETLWNVVGDYVDMQENLPYASDILGESAAEYWLSAAGYGLAAFADEVSASYFFPIWGQEYWDEKKMEDALLTLNSPCENITGTLKEETKQKAARITGNLAEAAKGIAAIGGGTAESWNLAEEMVSKMTDWSTVKAPDWISDAFSGLDIAGAGVSAVVTAGRYQYWSESFVEQLEYMMAFSSGKYSDYADRLNRVAKSLRSEYGNYIGNAVWEVSKEMVFETLDTVLEVGTPVGRVLMVYDLAREYLGATIPQVAQIQKNGDHISNAMQLSDLAIVMRSEYVQEIGAWEGDTPNPEQLRRLRLKGNLMTSAAAHSYDALYSAKEKERKQLADKLTDAVVDCMRFEETSQYDASLLLYEDFGNLYSETPGASRELIPPEYVRTVPAVLFSSHLCWYEGKVYALPDGNASPESMGLTALDVKPAAYDYIREFIIYRDRVYYICKEPGTSDFRSALYSCKLDGSEQKLLKDMGMNAITEFYIRNDRLYIWDGQYMDCETEEWTQGETAGEQRTNSEQYSLNYRYTVSGNGIYRSAYKLQEDGAIASLESRLVVPLENSLYAEIQAASDEEVYFTYWKGNTGYLYRWSEEEKLTELDSKSTAGGGNAYYNE